MSEVTFTTSTNWNVTYSPETRTGSAKWHKADKSEPAATFTVSDNGTTMFRTADAVPHDTISAVSRWIREDVEQQS